MGFQGVLQSICRVREMALGENEKANRVKFSVGQSRFHCLLFLTGKEMGSAQPTRSTSGSITSESV